MSKKLERKQKLIRYITFGIIIMFTVPLVLSFVLK